jgi:hypothetical protein
MSVKLAGDGQEVVAYDQIPIEVSCEEATEACLGAARPRAGQGGRPEQSDLSKWQRTYDHAITEFVAWYCSEPRLAFNRTVVLRYRIHLEQRHYAPATINLRLAAVRRVAYEAANAGLLSPELAASIRRVKGVRRLGVRLGNWLTAEQGRRLLRTEAPLTLRGLRDHAMVALPPRWWRTRPDSIPAGKCFDSDDRAISRLQAEAPVRGQRHYGA